MDKDYPGFEIVGDPCESFNCDGKLVNCIDLKTKNCYKECYKCGQKFYQMELAEKINWATRTINRISKGEKID